MKRFIALMLVVLLSVCMLSGCKKQYDASEDVKYVNENGKLVVGVTEFAPMDYLEDGEWVGFDAEMAKKFADALGVKVEFVKIDWEKKILELNDKGIDCVWNGMTLNDAVKDAMSTSNPYLKNAQVVVVKKDVADQYQTLDSIKDLKFAVEAGSAGEEMAKENKLDSLGAKTQAAALLEVKTGTADGAIIDLLMAGAMIGEGTDYEDLTYTVRLNSEEYGVGFRKGSDLTEKFNQFWAQELEEGTVDKMAEKYSISKDTIVR